MHLKLWPGFHVSMRKHDMFIFEVGPCNGVDFKQMRKMDDIYGAQADF